MPLCMREGFYTESNNSEAFNDSDKVFYCEVTKQIFRDYEDYFRHVMTINSKIWQCELTGKDSLTYAAAMKSERKALRKMETFKDCLRPVVMLVIEHAKQSSLCTLNALTFRFLRRRYFLNEKVQLAQKSLQDNQYVVSEILSPTTPIPNGDQIYDDTEILQYRLQNLVNKSSVCTVPFEKVRRQRFELTSENLYIFLKNNVVRLDGILTPNPKSYKLYVTDRQITFQSVFIGRMPLFSPPKTRNSLNLNSSKKQTTLNKYLIKNGTEDSTPTSKSNLNNNKNITTNQTNAMKDRDNSKALKEENERVENDRLARQKHFLELERIKAEKKAKLLEKIEEECTALLTKTDDLERSDQCLLPVFTPIDTLIPNELVGDAFMLREFMHSFSNILSGIEVFKGNLSFYELTRALTVREVAGPLSDIFLVLLGTVFDLQREEEEECDIHYSTPVHHQAEPYRTMALAGKVHKYTRRHFNFKINELPLDALTVSEVLRLHILSSGAIVKNKKGEKWRLMYRNGYSSSEDPGLTLIMQHPHIVQALKTNSVYQLPFEYIIQLLRCLMDQILTYSNAINLIEERLERMASGRQTMKNLLSTEHQRVAKVNAQQKTLSNDLVQQSVQMTNKSETKKAVDIDEKYNKTLNELNTNSSREHKRFEDQVAKVNASIFEALEYLGMDRAYRKYYAFDSMPGIFVEHHGNALDSCLQQPPVNAPLRNGFMENAATLPRNRKDLRAYLLRKHNEEERKAAALNSLSTKENKENHLNGSLNKLPNGVHDSETEHDTTKDTKPAPQQLYMCTGNAETCIVHNDQHPDRQRWSFIDKVEVLQHLLQTLNPLGFRESELKEQLLTFKDIIEEHIRKCPVDRLNVTLPDQRKKFKSVMLNETHRKYSQSNFDIQSDSNDLNEIMHAFLTQRILEFENEIDSGDLGKVRVKDLEKWRLDLSAGQYNPQVKLQWGPRIEEDHRSEDGDIQNQDTDNEEGTERSYNGGGSKYLAKPYRDLGDVLTNRLQAHSEDSADELSVKNLQGLSSNVKQLASALLQVEQGVEKRFLKEPYGVPISKSKDLQERKQQAANNRLQQWEISLMESTSYSQVFLHFNLLNDCIMWARSANKSNCMICRRGTDPEKMLLCDECNGGTHMFCMKPKMKTVPEGNWYCRRCERTLGLKNQAEQSLNKQKTELRRKRAFTLDEDSDLSSMTSESKTSKDCYIDVKGMRGRAHRGRLLNKLTGINAADILSEDETKNTKNGNVDTDEEVTICKVNGFDSDSDNSPNEDNHLSNTVCASDDNKYEDVCQVCSCEGSELFCKSCKDCYHLECLNLKRQPRYDFFCAKCKTQHSKRKRKSSSEDEFSLETRTSRRRSTKKRQRTTNQKQLQPISSVGSKRHNLRGGSNGIINHSLLYKLLEKAMKSENAWPFLRPVSQSEVPDYYYVIKKPMDFAKVKSKLQTGSYQTNEEVIKDIELIFANCDEYNVKGNEVYEAGVALEKYIMELCAELNLTFHPSDMNWEENE